MKKTVLIFAVFTSIFSCKKDQITNDFDASYAKFTQFKASGNNTYF